MKIALKSTFVTLAFLTLPAQGAPVQLDEDINSVMNSILAPPPQECTSTGAAIPSKPPVIKAKIFQNFWNETSCNELFSERPPAWAFLLNANIPTERIVKTWLPVCSLSMLADLKINEKPTDSQLLEKTITLIESEDRCSPLKTKLPPVLGFAFGGTSAIDPDLKTITGDTASKWVQLDSFLNEAKAQAQKICCPTELTFAQSCREIIEKIKIVPCKSNDIHCLESGFSHDAGFSKNPIHVAINTPSPIIFVNTKEFDHRFAFKKSLQASLLHELGHACSAIHRFHSSIGNDTNVQEFTRQRLAYNKNSAAKCAINSKTRETYRALFQGLIANQATYKCIEEVAQGATRRRFENALCGGCEVAYLEEAFAMAMQYIPITKTRQSAYATYYSLCAKLRTDLHPFGPDVLKCLLRDSVFKEKLKTVIGCS